MKRFLAFSACAMLLVAPLGGCSTIESLFSGGSVAQSAPAAVETAEKALTISHLAYQGVGIILIQGANSGALHGQTAKDAQTYYDQAGGYLDIADQADDAANAAGILAAIASANALIVKTKALIPPAPH